jgi:biopolymer transport protein ExbB
MIDITAPWIAIRSFFEAGGDVLWAIFATTAVMWALIFERLWYFRVKLPVLVSAAYREWLERSERQSWAAEKTRKLLISEISVISNRNVGTIQVLMAILPLLGLLGTVTGMIQVFNVMAIAGTSNARLMAGGVSAATIPTMSGLVAALSGLYLAIYLKRRAEESVHRISDILSSESNAP